MSDNIECNGVMFIGDPHVSSRKPGRRKDSDFGATVIGKIRFLLEYCNERKIVPVFLGDMYDTPYEPDEALKTKLLRTLRTSWTTPLANVGNHDIKNAVLTDGDSLSYLAEAGGLKLNAYAGALATLKVGGKTWGIGATPYGQDFPTDARHFFAGVDMIVWLTHHDLAFEDAYPGSVPPPEIKGCKLVVNGHMHLRKKTKKVGETVVFNPGNITRQFMDAIEHDPAAFVLTAEGKLEKVSIPHERAIFDLTGQLIHSISPGEAKAAKAKDADAALELADSAFVTMLTADSAMEMGQSDDGSIILEEIMDKLDREKSPADVRDYMLELHRRALAA